MMHLLIAEDERIERLALAKTLRDHLGEGCVIHEAENGRQALELFRQYPMSAVLLDIEMPVMNGMEAAQIIFEEDPNCGIIFLTAFDRFEYAKKAISVRALEYLLKPCTDAELLAAVEMALHRAQTRREETAADAQTEEEATEAKGDRAAALTAMMEEYISENYRLDISMQDAARAMNYSEPYFCKLFKQQFGQSFTAYLTEYRIRHARVLLCQPTVNIKDVGSEVGYQDPNYFAKVFRRLTGQSPSEYRLSQLS
jgi:YesN/AraC family two-component response regulator